MYSAKDRYKTDSEYRRKRIEYSKSYAKTHERKRQLYSREYEQTPKRIFKNIKYRCGKGTHTLDMTLEEFEDWYNSQEKTCVYCEIPETELQYCAGERKAYRLSIDRMDDSRGYSIDNIALCCLSCNKVKHKVLSYEEMKEVGKKFILLKWFGNMLENDLEHEDLVFCKRDRNKWLVCMKLDLFLDKFI